MPPSRDDLGVQEFADLLGLTRQRVHQLVQDGMPHRRRNNATRFVPRESIAWLRERDRESARSSESPSEADERARKLRAEADLKELELSERRRALVPIAEAETFLDSFVGGFAAVAAGRLQTFERDIVQAKGAGDARRLTQRMHAALMAGAQEYADAVEAEALLLPADDFGSPGEA
jgi:hypothetical protein